MDEDTTIRNIAISHALTLSSQSSRYGDVDSLIAAADKIANFIKDGTAPSDEQTDG